MTASDFWGNTQGKQDASTAWRQQIAEAKRDPTPMFRSMGWNIPSEIQHNPQAIVQYLQNTGQVKHEQVNALMQRLTHMHGVK